MSGFTIEGTTLGEPFPTEVGGVGLANFSLDDLREIEEAERKTIAAAQAWGGSLKEIADLEDETAVVPQELISKSLKLKAAYREAQFEETFVIVRKALCKHPSGEPLSEIKTVDDLKRNVKMRVQLQRAYEKAMVEMGKQD